MKAYNLYYTYHKINKYPLLQPDIDNIMNHQYLTYQSKKVNMKDVKVVECILI